MGALIDDVTLVSIALVSIRMTKMGEFLLAGRLFSFGSFYVEYYRSSPRFGSTFFISIDCVLILTKMGRATFRAIFPKLIWSPCQLTSMGGDFMTGIQICRFMRLPWSKWITSCYLIMLTCLLVNIHSSFKMHAL
jgi:hypothetical protein